MVEGGGVGGKEIIVLWMESLKGVGEILVTREGARALAIVDFIVWLLLSKKEAGARLCLNVRKERSARVAQDVGKAGRRTGDRSSDHPCVTPASCLHPVQIHSMYVRGEAIQVALDSSGHLNYGWN